MFYPGKWVCSFSPGLGLGPFRDEDEASHGPHRFHTGFFQCFFDGRALGDGVLSPFWCVEASHAPHRFHTGFFQCVAASRALGEEPKEVLSRIVVCCGSPGLGRFGHFVKRC